MKVIHVINSLSGSGGAEQGLVREVTRIGPGIEQLVVKLFAEDELASTLRDSGIDVVDLGLASTHSGFNWPLGAWRLRGIIRRFGPDAIHSSLFSSNLVAQLAARFAKTPVLSTFTLSGEPGLLRAYQPGADTFKASLLRRIGGVAARSDRVWFRALTHDALVTNCALLGVSESRVRVIPRGLPDDLVPDFPMTRAELGLPEDVRLIVNVGRQAAQKGQIHLLRSFHSVRQRVPAHLVIVGREGDASAQVKEAIRDLDLSELVSVVGYTTKVSHYLANADVFAFTSLMEGLGTAVIEAMAAGVPVVAFDIPPIREATNDGRLATLVPTGDEQAFSEAILSMLGGGDEVTLRTNEAKSWVDDKFAAAEIALRLESLLREVAGFGPGPGRSVNS